MEAYITGDEETGDAKMEEAKPLFKQALHLCGELACQIEKWTQRFDEIKARSDWPKISQKIYRKHKKELDELVNQEKTNW